MNEDMNLNALNPDKSLSGDSECQKKRSLQPMRIKAILDLYEGEDEDSDNKNDDSEDENYVDDCQPLPQDDEPINETKNEPEAAAKSSKFLDANYELKYCSQGSQSNASNSTSNTLKNVPEHSNSKSRPSFSWRSCVTEIKKKSPASKKLFYSEKSQENRRSESVEGFTSDFVKIEIDGSKKGVNIPIGSSASLQNLDPMIPKCDKPIFTLSSYTKQCINIEPPDMLHTVVEKHVSGMGSYKQSSCIRTSGNFQKTHLPTTMESGESNPADTPMKQQLPAGSLRPEPSISHRSMFQTPQGKIPTHFSKDHEQTPASILSSWKHNNLIHTPVENRPRENMEMKGNSVVRQEESRRPRNDEKHARRPLAESLPSDRQSLIENPDHIQRFENLNYASNQKRHVLEAIPDKSSKPSGTNSELKENLRPRICESAQKQRAFNNSENPQREQKARPTSEWPGVRQDYKSSSKPQNQNNIQVSVPSTVPIGQYGNRIFVNGNEYMVLGHIGQGMSGEVVRVFDTSKQQLRAIKYVNLARLDKEGAASCMEEINMLHKLEAPSVVKMFDHEVTNQAIYVVMEMGDTDFSRFLKSVSVGKSTLSLSMILYYWTEMLTAVKHIHDNGVIHSDLKPGNFLLVQGRLKLIDFGISSSLNADMTSVVKSSTLGTLNYISPESLLDIGGAGDSPNHNRVYKISYKSDVWSLGCILYSMVFGKTPFSSIRQQWPKIAAITNPDHKISFSLPSNVEKIPLILIDVMKKCLQYDPKSRPSCHQLLQVQYISAAPVPGPRPDIPPSILLKIQRALDEEEWKKFIGVMASLRDH